MVQADTHKTTATTTTRMAYFHHVGTVFQRCHIPVSSRVPDDLALAYGCPSALTCRPSGSHQDHLGPDAPSGNGDVEREGARHGP
jgi:hypothetical protein